MRLLLVEDEPRIVRFLLKGLRGEGYAVEAVETGREAVARLRGGERFDLVVLDLGLPDIDGLEVLDAVRDDALPLPVLVLTARAERADRAAALERGAAAYLVKPVPFGQLLSSVQTLLEAA